MKKMGKKESFGGELAKKLPIDKIYDDIAHPALSSVGTALQGTVRIALSPISALVWGYDKIAHYLDVAIPQYFEKRKIGKEKIRTPDPSIAGPILDALRFNSHKPELREMFKNILGASMNADSIDEHPAFVEIVKQLCSDECKLLKTIQSVEKWPMIKCRVQLPNDGGEVDVMPYFSDICYNANCEYPQKFPEYLDNLRRLGLVDVLTDRYLTNDQFYKNLRNNSNYPRIDISNEQTLVEKKSIFQISEMGKKFCFVCIE